MKKLILPLVLLPLSVLAQQSPNFNMGNQADIEKTMEAMQKIQACMMKINKKEMEELQIKSEALDKEIFMLCKKGKRKQAQQKAEATFEKMKNSPIAKKIKTCTDMMSEMDMHTDSNENIVHVCDTPEDNFSG